MTSRIFYPKSQIVSRTLPNRKRCRYKLISVNEDLWQNRNSLWVSVLYYLNDQRLVVLVHWYKPFGLTPSWFNSYTSVLHYHYDYSKIPLVHFFKLNELNFIPHIFADEYTLNYWYLTIFYRSIYIMNIIIKVNYLKTIHCKVRTLQVS